MRKLISTLAATVVAGAMLAATVVTSAPASAATITRHTAGFGRGVWLDACNGDVDVTAPLHELVPGIGTIATPWAEVDVQTWSTKRGRWVTRFVLSTNMSGVAHDVVRIGGGLKVARVVHPADDYTTRTVGRPRLLNITTEPCDIV